MGSHDASNGRVQLTSQIHQANAAACDRIGRPTQRDRVKLEDVVVLEDDDVHFTEVAVIGSVPESISMVR